MHVFQSDAEVEGDGKVERGNCFPFRKVGVGEMSLLAAADAGVVEDADRDADAFSEFCMLSTVFGQY